MNKLRMMSPFRVCPSNLPIPAVGKTPTPGKEIKGSTWKATEVMSMSRKPSNENFKNAFYRFDTQYGWFLKTWKQLLPV